MSNKEKNKDKQDTTEIPYDTMPRIRFSGSVISIRDRGDCRIILRDEQTHRIIYHKGGGATTSTGLVPVAEVICDVENARSFRDILTKQLRRYDVRMRKKKSSKE